MKKFHKLRATKNKLRPTKQKFYILKPTKNRIDWSTTGSETEWWHRDLASLSGSDSKPRCFGWTDQTHADQIPTPNSKQLTHATPRNQKKGAVLSPLNLNEDDMFGCENWMEICSWVWIGKKFREWPMKVMND